MGFAGFCAWFIGGLLITATLQIMFDNVFLTSFIVAIMCGVLGARE